MLGNLPPPCWDYSVKIFSLLSNSKSPQELFVPLPLLFSMWLLVKKESIFVRTLYVLEHVDKVSHKASFLMGEQTQFLQPFLMWQDPSLDPLQLVHILFHSRGQNSTVFQVWPHKCKVDKDYFYQCWWFHLDVTQYLVGFLCWSSTVFICID